MSNNTPTIFQAKAVKKICRKLGLEPWATASITSADEKAAKERAKASEWYGQQDKDAQKGILEAWAVQAMVQRFLAEQGCTQESVKDANNYARKQGVVRGKKVKNAAKVAEGYLERLLSGSKPTKGKKKTEKAEKPEPKKAEPAKKEKEASSPLARHHARKKAEKANLTLHKREEAPPATEEALVESMDCEALAEAKERLRAAGFSDADLEQLLANVRL